MVFSDNDIYIRKNSQDFFIAPPNRVCVIELDDFEFMAFGEDGLELKTPVIISVSEFKRPDFKQIQELNVEACLGVIIGKLSNLEYFEQQSKDQLLAIKASCVSISNSSSSNSGSTSAMNGNIAVMASSLALMKTEMFKIDPKLTRIATATESVDTKTRAQG